MGVWSSGDFALTEVQMTGSSEHVAGPWRYERLEGPGHWLQLEAPDEVNRLLLDFLPDLIHVPPAVHARLVHFAPDRLSADWSSRFRRVGR